MGDLGHELTEKQLAVLERRIARVYRAASADLKKKADEYFSRFIERDKEQQELLKAGKITEQQYKQWRLAQIGRGERFLALRDDMANRMTEANKVAISYVNDATPGIYSLNYNYAAYTIEQASGNVGFTLYDEQTVKRLIAEDPTLLPKRRVDAPKDLKWNKKRFTAEITAGILMGEPIRKIADRVENLSDANRAGAIRNARTAVTGAQNAGRQESYNRAKEMGLQLRKRWIATKDMRTRHEHALLDGQTVALDEPFRIDGHKLMFPGDPSGVARLVWNCRCTMRTVEKEGIEAESRQMRVRDPITGRNIVVNEMTYDEWLAWKSKSAGDEKAKPGQPVQVDTIDFSNKKSVIARLAEAEREVVGFSYEVNYTVTTDGKVWRVTGEAGSVNTAAIPSTLKGSYSYHNHPAAKTWYSFSAEDAAFFMESGEAYSKASDDLYEYVMQRTAETIETSYDKVYHRFKEIEDTAVLEMKWNGSIDPDLDSYHETLKILSQEMKFTYERKEKNK